MRKNKDGYIVNISSTSSFQNEPGNVAYGTSKAALNYATKIIAKELGVYGINVNCIAPGVTNTSMLKKMDEKAIQKQLLKSSNNKMAEPHEIADLVNFYAQKFIAYYWSNDKNRWRTIIMNERIFNKESLKKDSFLIRKKY